MYSKIASVDSIFRGFSKTLFTLPHPVVYYNSSMVYLYKILKLLVIYLYF